MKLILASYNFVFLRTEMPTTFSLGTGKGDLCPLFGRKIGDVLLSPKQFCVELTILDSCKPLGLLQLLRSMRFRK